MSWYWDRETRGRDPIPPRVTLVFGRDVDQGTIRARAAAAILKAAGLPYVLHWHVLTLSVDDTLAGVGLLPVDLMPERVVIKNGQPVVDLTWLDRPLRDLVGDRTDAWEVSL